MAALRYRSLWFWGYVLRGLLCALAIIVICAFLGHLIMSNPVLAVRHRDSSIFSEHCGWQKRDIGTGAFVCAPNPNVKASRWLSRTGES